MRKAPRYLLRSKSAIKQSTICGSGDTMYTASISGFIGRRCSICSISVGLSGRKERSVPGKPTRNVLVENIIFFDHIV